MDYKIKYPDLAPIVATRSWKGLFDLLYTLAQVKVASYNQLNPVNFQIATAPKLAQLAALGYIGFTQPVNYFTTPKLMNLLKDEKYRVRHLPKDFTGFGDEHQLAVTDCLLREMKDPEYFAVFYPDFKFLRPDAAIIYQKDNMAKLVFLEVERTDKDPSYLLNKKEGYDKLARQQDIYDKWWKHWSEEFNFEMPPIEKFCFSVKCVGNFKADWKGWELDT
jgi:hypothetical protein